MGLPDIFNAVLDLKDDTMSSPIHESALPVAPDAGHTIERNTVLLLELMVHPMISV
jgi:hypothetical protein